ncbi:hypothetical protein DERF_008654 [Dermatophagoides farinae]|uniref:Uncharacterized protein n=1 Tax=Dermatophagoides farinae TaxID=6954 RepID=A0A922L4Z9_DERFA|nr:hypothetical protein DERF_008654 [Dermatophagoides farinae]
MIIKINTLYQYNKLEIYCRLFFFLCVKHVPHHYHSVQDQDLIRSSWSYSLLAGFHWMDRFLVHINGFVIDLELLYSPRTAVIESDN